MTSRRQLYALGEPIGDSSTRIEGNRRIYGGGGGDSGGGTSVTRQEIPVELKPLANAYTQKAIGLSDQAYQPFAWDWRFANLNNDQTQAMNAVRNRALNGSQTMKGAEGFLNNTVAGKNGTSVMQNQYAGANPYLEKAISGAMDDVSSRVNSQFSGSNYGTTAHQGTLADALGGVSNQMRMQDYGNQQQLAEANIARNMQADQFDMGNQMAAMQLAPTFGNQAYQDANQLMQMGQIQQDQSQQVHDFWYQQHQEQQDLPYKQLAAMGGVFGSNLGGSSTTQQSGGGGGK